MRKTASLMPQDRVELIVETEAAGETLLTENAALTELMQKTVGASQLTFDVNSGDTLTVAGISFRVALKKL